MGTVGITSMGMFGDGAGWGILASSPTALMMTVRGIGKKPVIVDGNVVVREYLSLTISVGHDLVDGAPAARFTPRLKELIENGYGLIDAMSEPEQTPRSSLVSNVSNRKASHQVIALHCQSMQARAAMTWQPLLVGLSQ